MVSSRISPSESGGGADKDAIKIAAANKRHSGDIAKRKESHPPGEGNNHSNNNNRSKRTREEGGNAGTTVASTVLATPSTKSRERKHHRRRRHRHGSKDAGGTNDSNGADALWDADGGGQEDKFKLLVEFIPYVGLGDATRDNMVRRLATACLWYTIVASHEATMKLPRSDVVPMKKRC